MSETDALKQKLAAFEARAQQAAEPLQRIRNQVDASMRIFCREVERAARQSGLLRTRAD